ncbi:MAG: hypothetical protein ACLFRH_05885, partial [Halothiobacillaceae bacterium]
QRLFLDHPLLPRGRIMSSPGGEAGRTGIRKTAIRTMHQAFDTPEKFVWPHGNALIDPFAP